MATTKLRINKGEFTLEGSVVPYLSEFTPSRVVSNGWECSISPEEGLRCEAVRQYKDGEHKILFTITLEGKARLLLYKPMGKWTVLKHFSIPQVASEGFNGTVGLSGGFIDDRYTYYRSSDFQKFLDDHGLTAVRHEEPNQIYILRNAYYGGGECHMRMFTDGCQTKLSCDYGRSEQWQAENPMTCASEMEETIQISGATWVIIKARQRECRAGIDRNNSSCILFTLVRNPMEIVGLPVIK